MRRRFSPTGARTEYTKASDIAVRSLDVSSNGSFNNVFIVAKTKNSNHASKWDRRKSRRASQERLQKLRLQLVDTSVLEETEEKKMFKIVMFNS